MTRGSGALGPGTVTWIAPEVLAGRVLYLRSRRTAKSASNGRVCQRPTACKC